MFITPKLKNYLLSSSEVVEGVPHLKSIGTSRGLEGKDSFLFLCQLYHEVKKDLDQVLSQRTLDRKFIDDRVKTIYEFNQSFKEDKTVIGLQDAKGRVVFGPLNENFYQSNGQKIAPLPDYLKGDHVTLFSPVGNEKNCESALNAFHCKLNDEPNCVDEILKTSTNRPKWGADSEDSQTPIRSLLQDSSFNLTQCFKKERSTLPIKRIPGIALPCFFLFYNNEPVPLHLYDFALYFYENYKNKEALAFYFPKLENEEEARYIKIMVEAAEKLIMKVDLTYKLGTVRLMIVLENPRAILRTNEIINELYPYFAGASLGWHDYLAATARLFKEDGNYQIPVKADPNIVIKYIKGSHDLLAHVVGDRGGVRIGGMYGVLPISSDFKSLSFQITIKGLIKDVITQLKRNLNGFWIAHPDFIRISLALVHAYKDKKSLEILVKSLLLPEFHEEILKFIEDKDVEPLLPQESNFVRSLIVANLKTSPVIKNNNPEEIRYNVFQTLQYLTDWLMGNACVALPAVIQNQPVKVLDDLATVERSRWEVWHEVYHGRFSKEDLVRIAHEEMFYIRKDLSLNNKLVQVKFNESSQKWYEVAFNIMLKLMTDKIPCEFVTELLLPFTHPSLRELASPYSKALEIDRDQFKLDPELERFNYYFEMCGSSLFAKTMSSHLVLDFKTIEKCIKRFSMKDILEAASFHGDIGESKKNLDSMAKSEQSQVQEGEVLSQLKDLAQNYKEKFGFKFLISAKGKTAGQMFDVLKTRIENGQNEEEINAKAALFEITQKRMMAHPLNHLDEKIYAIFQRFNVTGAQISISPSINQFQTCSFGERVKNVSSVTPKTQFEIASLSKTFASAFACSYFQKKKISLDTKVNDLLKQANASYLIPGDLGNEVRIRDLMQHTALNMHYVNGVALSLSMPPIQEFLSGNKTYEYEPIKVINKPGTVFKYSGGGFIVLEYLLNVLEKDLDTLLKKYLTDLNLFHISFNQKDETNEEYAYGYTDQGELIRDTRYMFPSFAAGMMGSAHAVHQFLHHLSFAYQNVKGSSILSHEVARLMLYGIDKGAKDFMGCLIGLGIFTLEAGDNKFMLHQGSNDGYRCLYLQCYDGPSFGQGLVVLCNGESNGVLFNSLITQEILKEFKIDGINYSKFKNELSFENIPQEQRVNLGYKGLIFSAFEATRAEEIIDRGSFDPVTSYSLTVGSKVSWCTNDRFARAENLFSPYHPKFDPELFGKQGKIMDSWESVRHNLAGEDILVFEMKAASAINFIHLSTKYHFGNQTPKVKIEGLTLENEWCEILPETHIEGHAYLNIKREKDITVYKSIKVFMIPDGGLSRLHLFKELPESETAKYVELKNAKSIKFSDAIPMVLKPMTLAYEASTFDVEKNWKKVKVGELVDIASKVYGACVLEASNEHYSPASQAISPFEPLNMFDGMESARSRIPGHFEYVTIQLAKKAKLESVLLDFKYFVNNNPLFVEILFESDNQWKILVEKTWVKGFAGNKIEFKIDSLDLIQKIKVHTYPDGGMNRIHIYSRF